jgi:hypothetical protein
MLKFHINAAVIEWANVVLENNGECWLAGTGQVYHDELSARSHKRDTNPDIEAATYMLHFKKGDKIPATPEAVIRALQNQRMSEIDSTQVKDNLPKPWVRPTQKTASPAKDSILDELKAAEQKAKDEFEAYAGDDADKKLDLEIAFNEATKAREKAEKKKK